MQVICRADTPEFLCYINIHIKVNEHGIEYKNFLNVRRKYWERNSINDKKL